MNYLLKSGPLLFFALIISVATVGMIPKAQASSLSVGANVYKKHCRMCHGGGDMKAVPGAHDFPKGEGLMMPDRKMFQIISQGVKAMPGHIGILSNKQIESVITYLRTLN